MTDSKNMKQLEVKREIREGMVRKGGVNVSPTSPPPSGAPKGQGGSGGGQPPSQPKK